MSEGPGGSAESDVYTVLVMLATFMAAGATVFLIMRSQELFGTWNPFQPF